MVNRQSVSVFAQKV